MDHINKQTMSAHQTSIGFNGSDIATNKPPNALKLNGQTAANVTNGSDVPTIPIKPIRHTILAKRESQLVTNTTTATEYAEPSDKYNGAPVANTTEADEIEFLLDEIKDLEVPACRTDSEQDFEIDGSRVDLDLSLHLDSPIDTSWYYFSIIFETSCYCFFFAWGGFNWKYMRRVRTGGIFGQYFCTQLQLHLCAAIQEIGQALCLMK